MDEEISGARLQDLLDSDADVRIVDIRPPDVFLQQHIPHSENIPFEALTSRIDEVADADHIVTVCPHGQASRQAARLIASYADFTGTVASLRSGLEGWEGDLVTETHTEGSPDHQSSPDGSDAPF